MSGRDTIPAEAQKASALLRAAEALVRFGGALATLMILVIFALVCIAVANRYILGAPIQWADELIGYLLVATIMLGAAEALRRDNHISIDLLSSKLGGRGQLLLGVIGNLAVFTLAAIIGWSAWETILFARAFGSYSVGYIEIETWIPQVPLVFGAALLGLAAIVRTWRLFIGSSVQ
ncbi:MAG: TRAP transporter small permease [Dokdonella sp.]|uniref:TRAP transporter small permease n=1 Tax=Dokdonella sp. TaxID=2291710 RepID=UPI0025BA689C|nr:TRAP transporter small permease [Dokdonella sp.]MBZ0222880.1 TRAP transporter small permease [Dokdonella sp.]